jgi:hydrogenase expression/formation protein HypC
MCLAVPGKIVETYELESLRMGKIDYGGVIKEACLAYLPEANVGDYVIVHVGFAISQLDEEEALATLETFRELAEIESELDQNEVP